MGSLHAPFKKGLKDQSKEFNDLIVKKLEEKGIAVEYQRPKSKLTDELKRELTFLAYTNEGEMMVLAKDESIHILHSKDIRELQAKYNLQKGDKFDYCVTKTKTPKMKDGKKVYYGGKLQYETKRDFSNILRREELERSIAKENKAKEQRDKEWEEFLRQQKLEKEAWEADCERKEAEARKAKEEAWKRACEEGMKADEEKKPQEVKTQPKATINVEKTQSQSNSDTYFIERNGKKIEVTENKGVLYQVFTQRDGTKIISPLNGTRGSLFDRLRDTKTKTPPTTKTPKIKSDIDHDDFGRE